MSKGFQESRLHFSEHFENAIVVIDYDDLTICGNIWSNTVWRETY